ncbi:MAG: WecB/TagA/CpsF family glycosyltransferase [bacterium]
MNTITILNIPIHNISFEKALVEIERMTKKSHLHQITTVNPEFLVEAQKNWEFRKVLQEADLSLADGVGLQLGALLQGKKFKTRIPGSGLVSRLMPEAQKKGWRVFLLGALPGVAQTAACNLKKKYPKLKVWFSGADPDTKSSIESIKYINKIKPHLLLVAYGAPTQDLWIAKNRDKIQAKVAIGVGGTLDFLAGRARRAPKIISKLGLEWFFRLVREPWRLKRQLKLPYYVFLLCILTRNQKDVQ